MGLEPGDLYRVELGTITGNVETRHPLIETIMTLPQKVSTVTTDLITVSSCTLHWLSPEGDHSCLRGFQIRVKLMSNGSIAKEVAVSKHVKSFTIRGLNPVSDYEASIVSLCAIEGQSTESKPAVVAFTTASKPPKKLWLDNATPDSLRVKWDDVPDVPANCKLRYKLTLNNRDLEVRRTADIQGDRNSHTFTDLPYPSGSGVDYQVAITAFVTSAKDAEVQSTEEQNIFTTPPFPPEKLRIIAINTISWKKSITPNVNGYKVKWRKDSDETSKGKEAVIENPRDSPYQVVFEFPENAFEESDIYKVKIFAFVESSGRGIAIKSIELQGKINVTKQEDETFKLELCKES